jgi:hypothetical protein
MTNSALRGGTRRRPKLRRRVGPPRAGDLVLRAEVERTGAENASTRSHLGVSDRSALPPKPWVLRSIRPECAIPCKLLSACRTQQETLWAPRWLITTRAQGRRRPKIGRTVEFLSIATRPTHGSISVAVVFSTW